VPLSKSCSGLHLAVRRALMLVLAHGSGLPYAHDASLGLVMGLIGFSITIPKVSLPLLARSELFPLSVMGTTGACLQPTHLQPNGRTVCSLVASLRIKNAPLESDALAGGPCGSAGAVVDVVAEFGGTCSGAVIGHALGHHISGQKPSADQWMRVLRMFGSAATAGLVLLVMFVAVRPVPPTLTKRRGGFGRQVNA
jgi:hypothetical protein